MYFQSAEFENALSQVPDTQRQYILDQLCAAQFDGQLKDYNHPSVELAHYLLPLAAQFSIAPISGFHVGAVAVGASGALYLGANLECPGAPLSATLHAEQSAVLNAWIHAEPSIVALAVSESPCGHCRQFLWELSNADKLFIRVGHTHTDLLHLLPMPFGNRRILGQGLLDSPSTPLQNVMPIQNHCAQHALNAAQHSYAPYTQSP